MLPAEPPGMWGTMDPRDKPEDDIAYVGGHRPDISAIGAGHFNARAVNDGPRH